MAERRRETKSEGEKIILSKRKCKPLYNTLNNTLEIFTDMNY